jgi:hypothetical protein
MRYFSLLSFALLALLSSGCAPALSTFQPAHVAEKGHFQAELGMDVSIPTGTIVEVIQAGVALVEVAQERELQQAERKELFDAGVALTLNPPSVVQHIALAYTPLDNWEIGLRYSVSAIRLGTRYQITENKKHDVDFSIGAGVSRYVLGFPVNDIVGIVELDDFERWQFDFPIQIGKSGNWYRVWGGPRIMITTFGTQLTMNLPAVTGSPEEVELASFSGTGVYVGAQGGFALGYKHVFFAVELTLAELFSGGELNAFGQQALEVDLDSFIIYPAFGLMLEF